MANDGRSLQLELGEVRAAHAGGLIAVTHQPDTEKVGHFGLGIAALDLASEFRKHFEDGDATAEVPDFFGIGLMSDGDQTRSVSSADFSDFILR